MMHDLKYYILERERIRRSKMTLPPPWTGDPILRTYKFTNVQRKYDHTTRVFDAIYWTHSLAQPEDALFNCAVRRYTGTEEFAYVEQWITNPGDFLLAAEEARRRGVQIFTGAYVITNGGRSEPKEQVVHEYLMELFNFATLITDLIEINRSWEAGYKHLVDIPGFGGTGFMAKEVLLDYLLWCGHNRARRGLSEPSRWLLDYSTFTPVGPGARRGLNRLHGRPLQFNQPLKLWVEECNRVKDVINPDWMVRYPDQEMLTATDIQFVMCEFDKYMRVKNGEGRPRSRYVPRDR